MARGPTRRTDNAMSIKTACRLLIPSVTALMLAFPAPSHAAGGYANPIRISVNGLHAQDTQGLGVENGEPLAPPSQVTGAEGTCLAPPDSFGTDAHMADTIWYTFTAPSGPAHDIILDTEGSGFDTQLAVYAA